MKAPATAPPGQPESPPGIFLSFPRPLPLEMQQAGSGLTVERVLSGIHYFRCHDYLELVALVNILPEFIAQHPKVR